MTEFKFMPTLVSADEMLKMFNCLNNNKVKEGHIDAQKNKKIPVVISVF
jgi:hypothetical protein